ncbi:unnamed protein product [Pleuronectes platessa]|uniref:Uncharacterized protein n=1 Tax=Pleuronectes platessa TaxID=8262 RepID=A0A9N7UFV6_PLEPL|nr:unnamed protein product [Pleuronectes platessa]
MDVCNHRNKEWTSPLPRLDLSEWSGLLLFIDFTIDLRSGRGRTGPSPALSCRGGGRPSIPPILRCCCRIRFTPQLPIHLPPMCHVFPEQEPGSPAAQCHLDYNLQEAPGAHCICTPLDRGGEKE